MLAATPLVALWSEFRAVFRDASAGQAHAANGSVLVSPCRSTCLLLVFAKFFVRPVHGVESHIANVPIDAPVFGISLDKPTIIFSI